MAHMWRLCSCGCVVFWEGPLDLIEGSVLSEIWNNPEYLIPHEWRWEHCEEIPKDSIPNKFLTKTALLISENSISANQT